MIRGKLKEICHKVVIIFSCASVHGCAVLTKDITKSFEEPATISTKRIFLGVAYVECRPRAIRSIGCTGDSDYFWRSKDLVFTENEIFIDPGKYMLHICCESYLLNASGHNCFCAKFNAVSGHVYKGYYRSSKSGRGRRSYGVIEDTTNAKRVATEGGCSWSKLDSGEYILEEWPPSNETKSSIHKEAGIYCPNADLGHSDAQLRIAEIYEFGDHGREIDPVRAWVWYSLSSRNGNEQATSAVTRLTKLLTPTQLDEASHLLSKWEPGHCKDELVSTLYKEIKDDEVNLSKRESELCKDESLSIEDMDHKDTDINKSEYEPILLPSPSLDDNATEQLKYYWNSPKGPNNTIWLCRAADQDHPIAQRRVGFLYSQGEEGLPKDLIKAYIWFRLADLNRSGEAGNDMKNIEVKFSEEQYNMAQKMFKNWEPGNCEQDISQ